MIYLDNSATTFPKPLAVREAVRQAFLEFGANPGRSGYEMSRRTTEAVYDCRHQVADFFGARGPECVSFQPSCTQALNLVLKGTLKKGDHVVVSDLEHNAVMRPLEVLKDRGVSYTVVETFPGDNDATMDSFRKSMTPATKLVVCTHASNVFGICLPVERLGALCHQYGAKICVDCAQTAGVLPIRLEAGGLDYVCAAGHKGLYGPMGIGLLLVRDPADPLVPLVEGGTGTQSRSLFMPEDPPERFEPGTLNVPGILGLRAGIKFVAQKGTEAIYRAELQKAGYLYDRLSAFPWVTLYTPRPQAPYYVPVLSLNVKGVASEEAGEALARLGVAVRCGLHCAPAAHQKMGTEEGTIRVSPSVFTRQEELEGFVNRLSRLYAPRKTKVR